MPAVVQQAPNAAPRILGFLIILIYLYSAPDPYTNSNPINGFRSPRDQYFDKIARQRADWQVLNSSLYTDFQPWNDHWLNLTGFRQNDSFGWDHLPTVLGTTSARLGWTAQSRGERLSVYRNVTGIVEGEWVRSRNESSGLIAGGKERLNLTAIAPDIFWASNQWERNITGSEGGLQMLIEEKGRAWDTQDHTIPEGERNSTDYARDISAALMIGDESSSGDWWEVKLEGVHWPWTGSFIMTTTSPKFAGIFGLPHLAFQQQYPSAQRALNKTIDVLLTKKEKASWIDMSDPWSTDEAMAVPRCEVVVYGQVEPIRLYESQGPASQLKEDELDTRILDLENELRFPQGAPIIRPPALKMKSVIFSPDCGFMLESKGPPEVAPSEGEHLMGLKKEIYLTRVRNWSLIWGAVLFAQVMLLRMQMRESSTPSTLSRISYYTLGMMLGADCLIFGGLMLVVASAPAVFPSATLAAFAVILSLGIGIRFVAEVYNVQEPDRRERARLRAQAAQAAQQAQSQDSAAPALAPIITAAGADVLSPQVAAEAAARRAPAAAANNNPIIIPSDQDIDAEIAEQAPTGAAALPLPNAARQLTNPASTTAFSYGQYVFVFMLFFFFTISSLNWPSFLRDVYIYILSALYLSFWLAQIHRNVLRNCRKALLWKFILGQSTLRLVPFAYFYLYEENVLFAKRKPLVMLSLAGWVWIQIWVLVAQEVLGPRFGLMRFAEWLQLPDAWDYHPILREDDAERGGMPIGLVQAPGSPKLERVRTGETESRKKSDNDVWSVDCAICMQALEIPVVPMGGDSAASGMAGMLQRRMYMVTPCRHAFHSACLEGWMRYRLQCPICREQLPSL
jgi:hypothetical protein